MTYNKILFIGITIIIIGLIYFFFNPLNYNIFPKCPFFILTGLKCPGCGSQRALHSLLHLDIKSAFFYNMLLVLALPAIAILFYVAYHRVDKPALYNKVHSRIFIYNCLIIIILWWLIRNILNI